MRVEKLSGIRNMCYPVDVLIPDISSFTNGHQVRDMVAKVRVNKQ